MCPRRGQLDAEDVDLRLNDFTAFFQKHKSNESFKNFDQNSGKREVLFFDFGFGKMFNDPIGLAKVL